MSMYSGFDFEFEMIPPSGLLSYRSGRATSQRKFKVKCQHAEELALRLLGKYYYAATLPEFITPVLPAPFPFGGQLNMVATGFEIKPISECCFNTGHYTSESDLEYVTEITSLVAANQLEKYYYIDRDGQIETECFCEVTVDYEENPCDCLVWDEVAETWTAHSEILPGTCISSERNPAYEMFTLPNASLVWKNVLNGQGQQEQLKADSYAYKVIPKADIIVSWHNVPVQRFCQIETHLRDFRGTVNAEEWGDVLRCSQEPTESDSVSCELYEPETILFVDWEEDRSKRTDAFDGNNDNVNMNTTTLKLHFKQKRVEMEFGASGSDVSVSDDDTGIAGWNHLWYDSDSEPGAWRRVVVKASQAPIFKTRAFSDIFYPDPL